jgi:hypothetical protein
LVGYVRSPNFVFLFVLLAGCDLISGPSESPDTDLLVFHDSVEVGHFALMVPVMPDSSLAARDLPGTWSTSNPAVATVLDGGIVEAVAPGIATITYRDAGRFGRARITVVPPLADAATFGHAIIEGSLPLFLPFTPVTYSCGPGLFGGSTLTTAESTFRFHIRFPDSLRNDLSGGDQIACAVRVYRFAGWKLYHLDLGYLMQFLAIPTVQIVENPASADPTDITHLLEGASHYYVASSVGRSDTLLTIQVGDTLHIDVHGASSSTFNIVSSVAPAIAEASGSEHNAMVIGRSAGTAAIEIRVIASSGPMGPAGVFGVRVTN